VLFTSGTYSQPACAPETIVLLFGVPIQASDVDEPGGLTFAIWPFHLLFNLTLTLTWGIILAFSSASAVHDTPIPTPSRRNSHSEDAPLPRGDDESTFRYEGRRLWQEMKRWVVRKLPIERARRWIMFSNALAVVFVVMEIVMSEVQTYLNNILPGENVWGFGQACPIALMSQFAAFVNLTLIYHLDSCITPRHRTYMGNNSRTEQP
jgi:hypothetical protein